MPPNVFTACYFLLPACIAMAPALICRKRYSLRLNALLSLAMLLVSSILTGMLFAGMAADVNTSITRLLILALLIYVGPMVCVWPEIHPLVMLVTSLQMKERPDENSYRYQPTQEARREHIRRESDKAAIREDLWDDAFVDGTRHRTKVPARASAAIQPNSSRCRPTDSSTSTSTSTSTCAAQTDPQ